MIEALDHFLLRRSMSVPHDTEELTVLELLAKVTKRTNEVIALVNDIDLSRGTAKQELLDAINVVKTSLTDSIKEVDDRLSISKVSIKDLEEKRRLSATGDFTGTIAGRTLVQIFADIDNALSLSQTIIDMVNNHESIGLIHDGGSFIDTSQPTITVEGGLF